jgi:branched-subunit amino acid transport protein
MDSHRTHEQRTGEGVGFQPFDRDYEPYHGDGFYDVPGHNRQSDTSPQPSFQPSLYSQNDIKGSYSPVTTPLNSRGLPPRQRRAQSWLGIVLGGWWLEILSMFLAMAMFAALIATLRIYDGRVLQDWPFSISINALVAVQMVIMKTSMILVVASGTSSDFGTVDSIIKD